MKEQKEKAKKRKAIERAERTIVYLKNCLWHLSNQIESDISTEETKQNAMSNLQIIKTEISNL